MLRSLNYDILDVKATRWHDDFNTFKTGTKDLEVMMTNVIQFAFETVSSISNRVELLEVNCYILFEFEFYLQVHGQDYFHSRDHTGRIVK